jgi:hypothetical protein
VFFFAFAGLPKNKYAVSFTVAGLPKISTPSLCVECWLAAGQKHQRQKLQEIFLLCSSKLKVSQLYGIAYGDGYNCHRQ